MRVCRLASAGQRCPYGHMWVKGKPYAIHSHPYGTTDVVPQRMDYARPAGYDWRDAKPAEEPQDDSSTRIDDAPIS